MKHLSLVEPMGLLGEAIRDRLAESPAWPELSLLTTDEELVGTLTQVGETPALVSALTPESVDESDLIILCDEAFEPQTEILNDLSERVRVILASANTPPGLGIPVIEGVNLEDADRGSQIWLSPHPLVVLLTRVLAPLQHLGLESAAATALLPVSGHGQTGIDTLMNQTRALLSFTTVDPAPFRQQVAFNSFPADLDVANLEAEVRSLALPDAALSIETLQTGIFHSLCVSLHLRFREEIDEPELRDHLFRGPHLEDRTGDESDPPLSATDAATGEQILVGSIACRASRQASLWLAMDNLTVGAADNVVALAEALR